MQRLPCLLILIASLLGGCTTGKPPVRAFVDDGDPAAARQPVRTAEAMTPPFTDVIGTSVLKLLDTFTGRDRRIEIFDKTGKKVEDLPKQAPGSVSIYTAAMNGQDNFTFDKTGKIIKHMRSHGDDFFTGKWSTVAE
jgi:hypothetical protein